MGCAQNWSLEVFTDMQAAKLDFNISKWGAAWTTHYTTANAGVLRWQASNVLRELRVVYIINLES